MRYLDWSYEVDGAEITHSEWDMIQQGLLKVPVRPRLYIGRRYTLCRYGYTGERPLIISNKPEGEGRHRVYHLLLKLEKGWIPVYHLNRVKPNERRLRNSQYLGTVVVSEVEK